MRSVTSTRSNRLSSSGHLSLPHIQTNRRKDTVLSLIKTQLIVNPYLFIIYFDNKSCIFVFQDEIIKRSSKRKN